MTSDEWAMPWAWARAATWDAARAAVALVEKSAIFNADHAVDEAHEAEEVARQLAERT